MSAFRRFPLRLAVSLIVAGLACAPALADDLDTLNDRLDRFERDLRDLQLEVYKGEPADARGAPMGQGGAGSFTPGGGARIADMEQSLRDLRGQVEQMTFQVRQLQEKFELQSKETNYRLGALEGGAPAGAIPALATTAGPAAAPGAAPAPGRPTPPAATAGAPAQLTPGTGSATQGAPPGTLGTIPADAVPPAPVGPKEQYDTAMELLSRAQYSEAQSAFRGFVAANPTNELAGPAQYWVGDIAFTQKDYAGAAKAFADVLKRFAKTAKAPDAMLKLGLSLMELGQKNEACTTLGALRSKYPTANPSILKRGADKFKAAGCK